MDELYEPLHAKLNEVMEKKRVIIMEDWNTRNDMDRKKVYNLHAEK